MRKFGIVWNEFGGMLKQIRFSNVGYEGDIGGLILVVVFPCSFFEGIIKSAEEIPEKH
jgi:hypothetical protein